MILPFVALALSLAASEHIPIDPSEIAPEGILGWTPDESLALCTFKFVNREFFCQIDARTGKTSVINPRTWSVAKPLPVSNPDTGLPEARDADLTFESTSDRQCAWAKKKGLLPMHGSRTSPDGKATAAIGVSATNQGGGWKGGAWYPSKTDQIALTVTRDGRPWLVGTSPAALFFSPDWSPSGRRIVWLLALRRPVVTNGGGPRVQLLGNAAALSRLTDRAMPAIEQAGFAPTFVGPAQDKRAASVVYAAKGFEAEAKQLASVVPGGATVGALTWDSAFDLVVALGDSALGGKP